VLILLWFSGCSQSLVSQGGRAIEKGDYEAAKRYFQSALDADPADLIANRGLGQVYFHLKDYDKAIEYLEAARDIKPDDGTTVLYIGIVHEAMGDYATAEGVYGSYVTDSPGSKISRKIGGRLLYVRNEQARQQARRALEYESTLVQDTSAAAIVGVLPFVAAAGDSGSLSALGSGLAAAVSYDLFQIHSIKLVERLQLKYILEELERVESGLIARESSPRLGKLIGASHLISGSLSQLAIDEVSVQSGIINTADSLYMMAIDSDEKFSQIMRLQKRITFAIIDSLGVQLTAAERNAIEKIPTESLEAFLAYCRGVEQLDMGNYESANRFFDQAVALDPSFDQAVSFQEETDLLIEGVGTVSEFEDKVTETFSAGTTAGDEINEDAFDIVDPVIDPRTDDEPVLETGTVSIGGSIR